MPCAGVCFPSAARLRACHGHYVCLYPSPGEGVSLVGRDPVSLLLSCFWVWGCVERASLSAGGGNQGLGRGGEKGGEEGRNWAFRRREDFPSVGACPKRNNQPPLTIGKIRGPSRMTPTYGPSWKPQTREARPPAGLDRAVAAGCRARRHGAPEAAAPSSHGRSGTTPSTVYFSSSSSSSSPHSPHPPDAPFEPKTLGCRAGSGREAEASLWAVPCTTRSRPGRA